MITDIDGYAHLITETIGKLKAAFKHELAKEKSRTKRFEEDLKHMVELADKTVTERNAAQLEVKSLEAALANATDATKAWHTTANEACANLNDAQRELRRIKRDLPERLYALLNASNQLSADMTWQVLEEVVGVRPDIPPDPNAWTPPTQPIQQPGTPPEFMADLADLVTDGEFSRQQKAPPKRFPQDYPAHNMMNPPPNQAAFLHSADAARAVQQTVPPHVRDVDPKKPPAPSDGMEWRPVADPSTVRPTPVDPVEQTRKLANPTGAPFTLADVEEYFSSDPETIESHVNQEPIMLLSPQKLEELKRLYPDTPAQRGGFLETVMLVPAAEPPCKVCGSDKHGHLQFRDHDIACPKGLSKPTFFSMSATTKKK